YLYNLKVNNSVSMMAHEGVEGRDETLKGQVSGTKTTGNKQFSLSTFGSILIMLSILLFAVSMVSSIIKMWDFSYSLGIQVVAILSMVTGYTLRNKMIGPEANEKTYLLINTIHEFITSKLIEREITEIPVYDISKHGELVTFTPPQDFDVVEQTWVSRPFTLVTILNNRRTHKNLYNISEPVLTDFEKALLQRIFDSLKVFLLEHEIDFNRMDKELILYKNFIKILDVYGIDLAPPSLHKIWYYMKRDYVGYGKLDVLLKDPMIEDISCDGADISVYLYHRKYTNIETNVVFEEEELNMTILKLAQISGKSISTGYPILNARLPDGSRLEATLGREVTTRGGTITIRKFREEPFTPADLIKYGTFNTEVMAYLWLAVENNKNIIIVGETAAGKTTTLNAISLFIPSESKVITIEDTRELTLYHKNWIPATIRETYMGQEAANIDMFDLLRSALRQRPEFLLVGEIRGKEAYTLFQAMSTGHTTFSTMHAGSIQTAVNRLLSEPINVPLMMLSSLDIMIIQVLRNVGRRRARRVNVLSEFVGINAATGDISTRELYKWNPLHDVIELGGSSSVLDDIMTRRGWSKEQIIQELENRKAVLQYMVDMDINDYRDVSVIIRRFADSPGEVMDLIREGKTLLSEEHEHK
ncbi:MAG TPA: type II/IV secretion system ATPase subunit, partial [candidate division Zixibacteria bacterium]|nr:type II/IV secretion system ATPase subunit [candidate division Zixibacteria bacterium]